MGAYQRQVAAMPLSLVVFERGEGKQIGEGDWNCPACQEVNFARNVDCRKCGRQKPTDGPSGENAILALSQRVKEQNLLPGDWTCLMCQEINFGNRTACRKCASSRPAGTAQEQLDNLKGANQMPGSALTGAVVGYVRPGSLKPVSDWARQWDSGPVNGMLVGETELPAWLRGVDMPEPTAKSLEGKYGEPYRKKRRKGSDASDSGDDKKKKDKKEKKDKKKKLACESSSSSSSSSEEDDDEEEEGEESEEEKASNSDSDAGKKKKPKKKEIDVEEELAVREKMRARRAKMRVVSLD